MSNDAEGPLHWPRDGAEEDAELHRAEEIDKLARWAREQRLKPLTDALEENGLIRERREGWGRSIVPSWWPQVEPPETACPRCETPGRGPEVCELCADAQAASPDPDSMLRWWDELTPMARRLHLSARHCIDPWTGRACRVEFESTTIDEAGVGVSHARLHSPAPHTSWDLRAEG